MNDPHTTLTYSDLDRKLRDDAAERDRARADCAEWREKHCELPDRLRRLSEEIARLKAELAEAVNITTWTEHNPPPVGTRVRWDGRTGTVVRHFRDEPSLEGWVVVAVDGWCGPAGQAGGRYYKADSPPIGGRRMEAIIWPPLLRPIQEE